MRMTPHRSVAAVTILLLAVSVRGAQEPDEQKIPLDKLPKAVSDAVKAKFPKAKLVEAASEVEDGKTIYEVTIKDSGHAIDVSLTPEGKVVTVEKEIDSKDLPKVIADALESRYPKARIKKAEQISDGADKTTAYEMLITTQDKKKLEVKFDPAGKFLEEEAK